MSSGGAGTGAAGDWYRVRPYRALVRTRQRTPTACELLAENFRATPLAWIFTPWPELIAKIDERLREHQLSVDRWNLKHDPLPPLSSHRWYYALLARVNGALELLESVPERARSVRPQTLAGQPALQAEWARGEQLRRFLDGHAPLIDWMQNSENCADALIPPSYTPHVDAYWSKRDLSQHPTTPAHIWCRPAPVITLARYWDAGDVICRPFDDVLEMLRECAQSASTMTMAEVRRRPWYQALLGWGVPPDTQVRANGRGIWTPPPTLVDPVRLLQRFGEATVLWGIILRVNTMECALHAPEHERQLFQDGHAPLVAYILDSGHWLDVDLRTPHLQVRGPDPQIPLMTTPLERYWPTGVRAFHEDSLPCMTKSLNYLNYTTDTGMMAYTWPKYVSRLLPRRSGATESRRPGSTRGKKSSRDIDGQAAVRRWSTLAVECALTGGYRHAKKRPTFACRLAIRRHLAGAMDQLPAELVSWCEREFLVTQVRHCTALRDSLCGYGWEKFETTAMDTMDAMRGALLDTSNVPEAWAMVAGSTKPLKPRTHRRPPRDFTTAVMRTTGKSAVMPDGSPLVKHLDPETIQRISQIVERSMPGTVWTSTQWSALLRRFDVVSAAEPGTDVSEASIRRAFPRKRDYAIVVTLCALFTRHAAMRVQPVDADFYRRQRRALREYFECGVDDTDLPPHVGAVFLAPCCRYVKSMMPTRKLRGRAYGTEKVSLNTTTNTLVCAASGKSQQKQRHRDAELLAVAEVDKQNLKPKDWLPPVLHGLQGHPLSVSHVYSVLAPRYQQRCLQTAVARLPVVGRLLIMGQSQSTGGYKDCMGPVTFCPRCGFFTPWAMSRFGPNGFSCAACGAHEQDVRESGAKRVCVRCAGTASSATGVNTQLAAVRSLYILDDRNMWRRREVWLCGHCEQPWVRRVSDWITCVELLRGLEHMGRGTNVFEFYHIF